MFDKSIHSKDNNRDTRMSTNGNDYRVKPKNSDIYVRGNKDLDRFLS